jgi:hypothetical protein
MAPIWTPLINCADYYTLTMLLLPLAAFNADFNADLSMRTKFTSHDGAFGPLSVT